LNPSQPLRKRAVVLLSGGLDSGTALALWCAAGGRADLGLFADYGQRAAVPEAAASERLAQRFGAPWRRIELPWLGEAARDASCALVGEGAPLPEARDDAPGDEASAAAVWVPARNVVFCAAAAALAESIGTGWVVTGFNREEAATFPDNSEGFVAAMTAALALGTRASVRVASPTVGLDKPAIARAARAQGLGPEDFWSCYDSGPDRCGSCESCVRAKLAWGS